VAGISLFLSSLNVFFRDLSMMLPNVMNILLFTSPIMFPIDVFPASIHGLVGYSPFAIIANGYREPFIHNSVVDTPHMMFLAGIAIVLFISGLAFFRRLKLHFDSRL
jgi:ABC-type polysaccharide/polyol phosphate export permease